MYSIWLALGVTVEAMEFISNMVDFLRFVHCLANRPKYTNFDLTNALLRICLHKSSYYVVLRLVVKPATFLFIVLCVAGLIKRTSMYLIPWLVFSGFNKIHDVLMLYFNTVTSITTVAWTILLVLEDVLIWIVIFVNFRIIVAEEAVLNRILEEEMNAVAASRHDGSGSAKSRRET